MSGAPGQEPACRRCGRPVRTSRENYDVFEGMHYVCFHYEFEHDLGGSTADPDDDCGVPGCPSAPAVRHKDRLVATVRDLLAEWSAGPPINWDNRTVPEYLEALVTWLDESDAYYASRGTPVPWNGWLVMEHAMRSATVDR